MLQILTGRFWPANSKRFDHSETIEFNSSIALESSVDLISASISPTKNNTAELVVNLGLVEPENGPQVGTHSAVLSNDIVDQISHFSTINTGVLWVSGSSKFTNLINNVKPELPRLFQDKTVSGNEISTFYKQLLSLPREKYNKLKRSAEVLNHLINTAHLSYDSAFSSAIFSIESLVSKDKKAQWRYLDEGTRSKLEKLFNEYPDKIKDSKIKEIFLENQHFKLQAKFIEFVEDNLSDKYFQSKEGVRKSDLKTLLINAYSGRSRYVHSLSAIEKPKIKVLNNKTILKDQDGTPHYTLQGILYLAFEVINNIIRAGPYSESEDIDISNEISGITRMKLAQEYWLGNPQTFDTFNYKYLFGEVLSHFHYFKNISIDSNQITDLRPGLKNGIKRFEQLTKDDKRYLLGMCLTWNWFTAEEYHLKESKKLFEKNKEWFEEPHIDVFVLHIISDNTLPWEVSRVVKLWESYQNKKYPNQKNRSKNVHLKLHDDIESACIGTIANEYLKKEDIYNYTIYSEALINDEGRSHKIREYIIKNQLTKSPHDPFILLRWKEH